MHDPEKVKLCTLHNENGIHGFFGKMRFLSNFEKCHINIWGWSFPTSEHAYMWAKQDPKTWEFKEEEHSKLFHMEPNEAKKWGKTVELRSDWERVKKRIMLEVVLAKFSQNPDLREKLLATGNRYLEELNWWKDTYWGFDHKLGGQNWLGKILMTVREYI